MLFDELIMIMTNGLRELNGMVSTYKYCDGVVFMTSVRRGSSADPVHPPSHRLLPMVVGLLLIFLVDDHVAC